MLSVALAGIILLIIPIITSINYQSEADPLFREMVGSQPRQCDFAILVFGYSFAVLILSLILSALFCNALEFRITYFAGWLTFILGVGTLISECVHLAYENPVKCDQYESRLVYALYSNQTSDHFRRWLRQAGCREMADCVFYAHEFVSDTCRKFFIENCVLVSCGWGLILIWAVCFVFGGTNDSQDEEEEDVDGAG
jgi:hypothetical protein